MPHKLDPLLSPRSIAVLGASQRAGTVGNMVLQNLRHGAYGGRLYAVNPNYSEVEGVRCYPTLADLPEVVEHVIFALADERIEAAFDAAIAHGSRAASIFSALLLEHDCVPSLQERITAKAKAAGMLLCGANGMGFYNFTGKVWACGFDTRAHAVEGNVSLVSQSGAGMSGILDVDERIDFNFAVSGGQELIVSAEDYLDYALEQAETRVIGFFMESSRQPDKLLAVFEKARSRRIPIVVLKVGRTPLAAKLAESHSGAMTGNDRVFDALFDYYGVQRVADMDELATALIMFAQPHPVHKGGIVSLHDSGGERQLIIDLADKLAVPFAAISPETTLQLQALLDPGLPAVNPLDAWSRGGPDYHQKMSACFSSLLADADAALGAVVHDRAPFGHIYTEYIDYLREAQTGTGKPVFLVSNRQGTGEDHRVVDATRAGLPVIDGVSAFLTGARCLLNYRDFLARAEMRLPTLADEVVRRWQRRFQQAERIGENEAACFFSACGVPVLKSLPVSSEAELLAAASTMAYPLVMKTAAPGLRHKSEKNGVILAIHDEAALRCAYQDLASRLGAAVLLSPMQEGEGVEMILGISQDEQFGPVLVMGFGGIYTELLEDIVIVKPPFDTETAFRCLQKLNMRRLLDGQRGAAAVDVNAYCQAAAALSVLAISFREQIAEAEINPLKLTATGCLGLDALLILKAEASEGDDGNKSDLQQEGALA